MEKHLRSLFGTTSIDHSLVEHVVSVLCDDNLDLAVAVLEKEAAEKSVREIDASLASSAAPLHSYTNNLPSCTPLLSTFLLFPSICSLPPSLLPSLLPFSSFI
jgi:Domain of unknown function (DUF3819)